MIFDGPPRLELCSPHVWLTVIILYWNMCVYTASSLSLVRCTFNFRLGNVVYRKHCLDTYHYCLVRHSCYRPTLHIMCLVLTRIAHSRSIRTWKVNRAHSHCYGARWLSFRMPDSQPRGLGLDSTLLPFRSLGMFVLSTMPQFTQLYTWVPAYLPADSFRNVNECVGMNRSARGWSVNAV